mgnify:CR=1 FL=1
MNRILTVGLVGLLLVGCTFDSTKPAPSDRDNTAVNERDADDRTVTPMDQSNASADIDQVAAIRKAVLDIEDLSVNGRNVKIITDGGKVVLRGPVASSTERDAIARIAGKVAGTGNVTNELEVEKD